ncbi:hypothetical protein BCR41DRAFT_366743 [Lobosporangium transversale]|uniref:Xylanolytic transcriptional activator regulatory domain-containing protein n=1 Tax=Lobosporangium transversale TaxID=64571 RepID=A0A1Y2H3F4_9FUNG|nr:hypothetical protein BCR41DRAFT_366743 [Lobosporangium transversale]ORZ29090.1 hypothetical protein BCR41DRAFT_366743 [Lobosporangium transversale]|eukprot:XP_021886763.1 hypothetical protein BCR41DRAFT_366743 [Lobosporangium transversale]
MTNVHASASVNAAASDDMPQVLSMVDMDTLNTKNGITTDDKQSLAALVLKDTISCESNSNNSNNTVVVSASTNGSTISFANYQSQAQSFESLQSFPSHPQQQQQQLLNPSSSFQSHTPQTQNPASSPPSSSSISSIPTLSSTTSTTHTNQSSTTATSTSTFHSTTASTSASTSPPVVLDTYKRREGKTNHTRKSAILRVPFPARAPPPPKSVAQLEEAMIDLKLYDSCLFWGGAGAVNLKPEGNSWDDDMVIQSKDPAWVRNSVQPPIPTNQELLILPPIAKIERSIEVFFQNAHLFPPFITPLIVERATQTRSNQVSRILLNTITGIAIRINPDIENTPAPSLLSNNALAPQRSAVTATSAASSSSPVPTATNKIQYMRYFKRAYGLMAHLEDNRSTYSTAYLQATLLLCYVYPKPQLRVELLKLMTEAAFLGLHVDATRWMPKPIVIQNRCWLFWACYMFDSVHHVIRGHLTQMDDHYLEAPFPQLTELDHDEGLWTRWFMVKEINLWRIGRKIHSFFQTGLQRMDQLIETGGLNDSAFNYDVSANPTTTNSLNLTSIREVLLSGEHSEAELVLALKYWLDDLPPRLMAQLDPASMDLIDPRVNGRAVGLQVVYSMLKVLLLYPSMLAIGTELLSLTAVASVSDNGDNNSNNINRSNNISLSNNDSSMDSQDEPSAGQSSYLELEQQQQRRQHQHFSRRQAFLDKIMQCVQEADHIVTLAIIVLERYPERARMSCLGVALDWCLRIYHKIILEKPNARPGGDNSPNRSWSNDNNGINRQPQSSKMEANVFSNRLKDRCRTQLNKVAKLLDQFEGLDHKHYFSWLTIELESLEEHQKAMRRRIIEKCLEPMTAATTATTSAVPPTSSSTNLARISLLNQQGLYHATADFLEQQQQQQQSASRPRSHDLQAIIRKRQQMGVYANSGIRPNGGNYTQMMPGGTLSTSSTSPGHETSGRAGGGAVAVAVTEGAAMSTTTMSGSIMSSSAGAPSPSTDSSDTASPSAGSASGIAMSNSNTSGAIFTGDSEIKSSIPYSSAATVMNSNVISMAGIGPGAGYPSMELAARDTDMTSLNQYQHPQQQRQQQHNHQYQQSQQGHQHHLNGAGNLSTTMPQGSSVYHFGYQAQAPTSGIATSAIQTHAFPATMAIGSSSGIGRSIYSLMSPTSGPAGGFYGIPTSSMLNYPPPPMIASSMTATSQEQNSSQSLPSIQQQQQQQAHRQHQQHSSQHSQHSVLPSLDSIFD